MLFVKRLAHIRQLFLEALLETVLDAALLTGRHAGHETENVAQSR